MIYMKDTLTPRTEVLTDYEIIHVMILETPRTEVGSMACPLHVIKNFNETLTVLIVEIIKYFLL